MPRRLNLSPSQKAALRQRINDLYLTGISQTEIAAAVGVSQQTVSRELVQLQKVWEREQVTERSKVRHRELARIDKIERTAWAAWERSCKDAETRHVEITKGKTNKAGKALPDVTKSTRTEKGQTGDPRHLERISWCVHERAQLLGLIVEKHEVQAGVQLGIVEEIVDVTDHETLAAAVPASPEGPPDAAAVPVPPQ